MISKKLLIFIIIIGTILFILGYFLSFQNTIYTFIHPTKTGGCTFENYINKHYNTYIKGCGGDHKKNAQM